MQSLPTLAKKKTSLDRATAGISATQEINKYIQSQQTANEEIEQAMYIQIDDPQADKYKKVKLVKQKPDQVSKSPRPRKIAANEGGISDVSDVEPAPNTGN